MPPGQDTDEHMKSGIRLGFAKNFSPSHPGGNRKLKHRLLDEHGYGVKRQRVPFIFKLIQAFYPTDLRPTQGV